MTLNDYIFAPYEDGGRGPAYDCWGLVRAVRHELYGCQLLPSFGHITRRDSTEFHKAHRDVARGMRRCDPETGAIAVVYTFGICRHVGVVVLLDGKLSVMETTSNIGVTISPVKQWESRFNNFSYFSDLA